MRNRGRHPRVGSEKISRGFCHGRESETHTKNRSFVRNIFRETTSKVRENRPKGRTATDTFVPRLHIHSGLGVEPRPQRRSHGRGSPRREGESFAFTSGARPIPPLRPASSHRARRLGGCSVRNGHKSDVSFRALFRNPAARHLGALPDPRAVSDLSAPAPAGFNRRVERVFRAKMPPLLDGSALRRSLVQTPSSCRLRRVRECTSRHVSKM